MRDVLPGEMPDAAVTGLAGAAPEAYRLLLVDDDEVDRLAVRRALRSAGVPVETTEAADVAAALAALEQGGYDCILLDYQLPGGDGMRVLRGVRERGLSTPVIMLTGHADQELAVELMKAGAADYLAKASLSPARLEQALRHAVGMHRAELQTRQALAALRTSEERYRLVTRATNDIIWDWDLQSSEVLWNEALLLVFGYTAAEVKEHADWWYAQIHPEDRVRVVEGIHRVIEGGGSVWSDEYRYRRADGGYAVVFDRGYVARDAAGRPLRMIGAMQDITERRRNEQLVRDAEERLRLALEAGDIGTWDFSPATGQLTWDARCRAAFGLPADTEVDFATFLARLHPDDREPTDRAVQRALDPAGTGDFALEYRALWPDGGVRWIVARGRAVFEGDAAARHAVRFIGTVLDITERKAAEAAREQALQARSRFYANMSHELRTPINAVLGYNELLLEGVYGPLNEAQESGIERSQRAARHLLELVNDVLDLSKLEAGKVELQMEEVSIPALIEDLFATIRPLAEEHACTLQLHLAEHLPRLRTDPRRVRQILLNLLSNAIKFGGGKPVRVLCVADCSGLHLEVMDQGPGIAPADLARVFEEFVQLNHGQGGTGLGLPISKRLAELLGGRLAVDSAPGAGSTFRLTLPTPPPAAPGR